MNYTREQIELGILVLTFHQLRADWLEQDVLIASLREQLERKPAYLSTDYQRMWDLVRYKRGELMEDGLITREEYAQLLSDESRATGPGHGSPSPRRLESYDELRATAKRLREALEVIDVLLAVPAAEYVPAIADALAVITTALAEGGE